MTAQRGRSTLRVGSILIFALVLFGTSPLAAQERGTPEGEWRGYGGDAWNTRYSPLDQINAENFGDLEVAWVWRTDNYGPNVDNTPRATPTYANGTLYTVAGNRRTLVAIDPATGETLWSYREPHTERWERSPRKGYGKGVTYYELDGRPVLYITTPGFFLHAVDAETGLPLEGFGGQVPIEGFPATGVVDMLANLERAAGFDPYSGPDPTVGNITTSAPPIVVNDVVIVGSAAEQGLSYTRIEQIPGDILAYDARSGAHLWTFHVIPRPGEFGHETWESDAWEYSGNANSWAGISADLERGIVYLPTDAPTNDAFGGFRPGDNLFGTSVIALDARTGERVWHFQTVHHDMWDWDNPVPPILLDVTVNGQEVPIAVQTTKQGNVYTWNRVTGEPIWPIPETPVPQSRVPGEQSSPTQPIPTRPAPYEIQGLSEDELIDWTPELRQRAIEAVAGVQMGPIFLPPIPRDSTSGFRVSAICPSVTGGTNIIGGSAADPETGILYVASVKSCTGIVMVPGSERDQGQPGRNPGSTVVQWVQGPGGGIGSIEGLSPLKPPYGRITAIDMNTGDHLWWIPNGDTPDRILEHPLLQGIDVGNTGQSSHATVLVTGSLLMYGEGRSGRPLFHAVDKLTGEPVGTIELPESSSTAPMSFMHDGVQYILVPVTGGGGIGGALVALRLE
jgi:quinoprotein glucose dehydrogenase